MPWEYADTAGVVDPNANMLIGASAPATSTMNVQPGSVGHANPTRSQYAAEDMNRVLTTQGGPASDYEPGGRFYKAPTESNPVTRMPTSMQSVAAAAAPAEWDGQFWDDAKLKAAVAAQGQGNNIANEKSWMAALNPLSGISIRDQAKAGYTQYGESSDNEVAATGAVYQDKLGRTYKDAGKDADGNQLIQYFQNDGRGFNNPTGSQYDSVQPTYKLGPDGTATPTAAPTTYTGSEWVRNGRDVAKGVATMVAAYFGGSWLAAYQAGAVTAPVAGAAATQSGTAIASGAGGTTAGGTTSAYSLGGGAATGGGSGAGLTANAGVWGAGTGSGVAGGAGAGVVPSAGVWGAGTGAATAGATGTGLVVSGAGGSMVGANGVVGAGGLGTSGITGSTTQTAATETAKNTLSEAAKRQLLKSGTGLAINALGAGAAAGAAAGGVGGGGGDAGGDQSAIAGRQVAIGDDQIAWNKKVYGDGQATRDAATGVSLDAARTQLGTAQNQAAIAADYDAYNKSTLRPLEQKIASDAMGYDTAGRRMEAIAGAKSDVEQAYAGANASNNRALMRSGIAPGGTRMQALMADQAIAKANAVAGATTGAVRNVENTGAMRMADAAKTLSYLPNAQATAAAGSTAAGTGASGSAATGVVTQGAGVGNVNTGYAGAVSANNSAGNLLGQANSEANKESAANAELYGKIGGAVGNWATSKEGQETIGNVADWFSSSDKKVKKNTGRRGNAMQALAEINKTPVDAGWSYDKAKGGLDDGGVPHTGAMAQEVRKHMGESVAPGGKVISNVDMAGKLMLGMQALAAKVAKLEKRS